MHRAAHKSPGTQPAMRRAATETPPLAAEYTIKEAVGGISWPTGAVAIFTAAEKPLSYPCSSSRGSMTPPIAVAAAMPEPDMEPNMALPAMLVMAREPGTLPRNSMARLISRLAMPPLLMSRPASTKKGTAKSVKLSMPLTIFWAETNIPNPGVRNIMMVSSDAEIMLNDTGTLMASMRKNTRTRTMAA